MLRRKLLLFEHALCLYLLAQTIFPSHFTLSSTLLGFTVLSFLKYKFEGIRIAYCILTAIQSLSILLNFTYIRLVLTVTAFITMYYFPMYKYPIPTGRYLVGYKMLDIENPKRKNVNVAMYYPTHKKTRDAKYSTMNGPLTRFADGASVLADMGNKQPISRLFVRTMYNFLGRLKLGVNENAKITKSTEQFEQGFPCIIFSHGLAMNMHIYNLLLKEWASNGFIVFTVDHDEEIFRKLSAFSSCEEYNTWRNSQLIVRKQTVSKLLDILYNPTELHKITGDATITLNYDKIFLAGHSFGGGNAGELAAEDKRVTGGVVLLDPSFDWCDTEILHKPINKPVLCLRSNQYENGPAYPDPSRTYARKCNENRENTVSGYFKGTMHHCTSDLMLFISRELAFLGEPLIKEKEIENQIVSNVWLTKIFLEAAIGKSENVNGRQGEIEGVKWGVLERFREKMDEMGRKNVFIVDK